MPERKLFVVGFVKKLPELLFRVSNECQLCQKLRNIYFYFRTQNETLEGLGFLLLATSCAKSLLLYEFTGDEVISQCIAHNNYGSWLTVAFCCPAVVLLEVNYPFRLTSSIKPNQNVSLTNFRFRFDS